MMVVAQAAKHADRSTFNIPEAFDILCDTIDLFNGSHFRSAGTRQHLVEAVNVALSSMPGNRLSLRCVELAGGTYAIEWLPYVCLPGEKTRPLSDRINAIRRRQAQGK